MWVTLYVCLSRQDGRDTPVVALSVKPNFGLQVRGHPSAAVLASGIPVC
jgi:hypothetical protein